MLLKLFALLLVVPSFSSEALEVSATQAAVERATAVEKTIDLELEKLRTESETYIKRFHDYFDTHRELQPLSEKYRKLKYPDKKAPETDEAELAILESKTRVLEEKMEEQGNSLFLDYPFVTFVLVRNYADQKKGKKPHKLTPKTIVEILEKFKLNGEGLGLISRSCFDAQGFKLEKKCIKSALDICNKEFSSYGETLNQAYINSDLEVVRIAVPDEETYIRLKKENGELPDKAIKFRTPIFVAGFSTCQLLKDKKISFEPKSLSLQGEVPGWMTKFLYGSTYQDRNILGSKCLSESGVPKNIAEKIRNLSSKTELSYPLDRLPKALEECRQAISKMCNDTYLLDGKIILGYATQNCTKRAVTGDDIKNDINRWKNAGIEEAEIKSHAQALSHINFCTSASEYGYYWPYKEPVIEKNCKKVRN